MMMQYNMENKTKQTKQQKGFSFLELLGLFPVFVREGFVILPVYPANMHASVKHRNLLMQMVL